MWPDRVKNRLERLAERDPLGEFVWCEIAYALHSPIEEDVLERAERILGFELPLQYRMFLLKLGNGGTGPGEGIIPFDLTEINVESAGKPFPFAGSYNEEGTSQEEQNDSWEMAGYGLLPIAHYGCGQFATLILNGPFHGEVWIANWAVDAGIQKFGNYAQEHDPRLETQDVGYDFERWYDCWLDGIEYRIDSGEKLEHWPK